MRELFKALSELETRLMEQYGVSLNEAMALCCIGGDTLTASVISENTGLSASHTSKAVSYTHLWHSLRQWSDRIPHAAHDRRRWRNRLPWR